MLIKYNFIADLIKAGQDLANKDNKIEELEKMVNKQKSRGDTLKSEVDRLKKALAEETEKNIKASMDTKIQEKLEQTMAKLVLLENDKLVLEQEVSNNNRHKDELTSKNQQLTEQLEKLLDPKGKKKKKK